MKTAVIGANGFFGKAIIENLILEKWEVIAVYNRNKNNIRKDIKSLSISQFLSGNEDIDSIIFSPGSFQSSIHDNILLNKLLFELTCIYNHCRFLYISSANVYGNTTEIISENSPFYNPGNYGLSKLSGEYIVSSVPSYCIVRPVYLYGKGLNNNSFLPFLLKKAKEDQTIPLFGKGNREQDYLHVNDAAKLCIAALLDKENNIYLGATGKSVSNLKIANEVCSLLSNKCEIKLIKEKNEGVSFYYNPSWTMNKLGWKPLIDLKEGLRDMII